MKRLSDLDIGQSGDILCVTAAGGMRRRLMDLGFTMGARAECLRCVRFPHAVSMWVFICGAIQKEA